MRQAMNHSIFIYVYWKWGEKRRCHDRERRKRGKYEMENYYRLKSHETIFFLLS